jgi:DNA-binding transcriptional LysR family regulator
MPSGLVSIPVLELDLVLALPPSHSLAVQAGAVDIGLLADEPIIMNELSIGYGQIVSRMFTDLGIQPQIKAIVDNVETIKAMVQSGSGVAIIPSVAATAEAKLGLIELRSLTNAKKITISAYHSRQALSRRKKTLINWLLKSAKT